MGADVVAVWPGEAGAVAGGVVGVVHGYFKVRLRTVSTWLLAQ